jgi:hypothetical protein
MRAVRSRVGILHPAGLAQALTLLMANRARTFSVSSASSWPTWTPGLGASPRPYQTRRRAGPLVADLKTLTTRREHLLVRLNGGAGERRVQIANLRALEVELRGYLARWTDLLHKHAQQARRPAASSCIRARAMRSSHSAVASVGLSRG